MFPLFLFPDTIKALDLRFDHKNYLRRIKVPLLLYTLMSWQSSSSNLLLVTTKVPVRTWLHLQDERTNIINYYLQLTRTVSRCVLPFEYTRGHIQIWTIYPDKVGMEPETYVYVVQGSWGDQWGPILEYQCLSFCRN